MRRDDDELPIKTKVRVNGELGWVSRIRCDSDGVPVYSILLESGNFDMYYARRCELGVVGGAS